MSATFVFSGTAGCSRRDLGRILNLRWMRRLPALVTSTTATGPGMSPPAERIRCSVIIAARDEETRIEGTVRLLLAQRGVEAEFIIVDDRSTDRTGENPAAAWRKRMRDP